MKRRPSLLIPAVLALTAISAGLLWYLGDLRAQRSAVTLSDDSKPVPIGGPFALTDQNGMRRTDADFRGKYMLVFFGYTFCPDVCPTTLAVEAAALEKMGAKADRIVPIFISVDPKRDTPEKMKLYLSAFGSRFVGLTGSDQDVAAAAKAYRVYYQIHPAEADGNYTVDHSGIIYLMGPDGKFVSHYDLDSSADQLAADLTKRTGGAS